MIREFLISSVNLIFLAGRMQNICAIITVICGFFPIFAELFQTYNRILERKTQWEVFLEQSPHAVA